MEKNIPETCARDRLISAAREMFACKGFHAAPMAELAIKAQVSVGQMYRLFENKDDIIAAIVREETAMQHIELTVICDRLQSGQIDLQQAFEEFVRNAISRGAAGLRYEILAEAHRNVRVANKLAALFGQIRDVVGRLVRAAHPELSDEHIAACEEVLLAFRLGIGHRAFSNPALGTDETITQTALMLRNAVAASAGMRRE
jgi:TetR/AcrR family transcriptional repressor of uid operon